MMQTRDWSTDMFRKFCIGLFSAGILLGTTSFAAVAQVKLSMNQITCGALLGYDPTNQNFVKYWMSGYYSASRGNDVLDLQRLETNTKRVLDYCRRHKAEPLSKAINVSAR
jgi:hypothetical protein